MRYQPTQLTAPIKIKTFTANPRLKAQERKNPRLDFVRYLEDESVEKESKGGEEEDEEGEGNEVFVIGIGLHLPIDRPQGLRQLHSNEIFWILSKKK